jgi:hypothetical protein
MNDTSGTILQASWKAQDASSTQARTIRFAIERLTGYGCPKSSRSLSRQPHMLLILTKGNQLGRQSGTWQPAAKKSA